MRLLSCLLSTIVVTASAYPQEIAPVRSEVHYPQPLEMLRTITPDHGLLNLTALQSPDDDELRTMLVKERVPMRNKGAIATVELKVEVGAFNAITQKRAVTFRLEVTTLVQRMDACWCYGILWTSTSKSVELTNEQALEKMDDIRATVRQALAKELANDWHKVGNPKE